MRCGSCFQSIGSLLTVAFLISLSTGSEWTADVGNWFDPVNWDAGVPTASEAARILNGGTAQTSPDDPPVDVNLLSIGSRVNDPSDNRVSYTGQRPFFTDKYDGLNRQRGHALREAR